VVASTSVHHKHGDHQHHRCYSCNEVVARAPLVIITLKEELEVLLRLMHGFWQSPRYQLNNNCHCSVDVAAAAQGRCQQSTSVLLLLAVAERSYVLSMKAM